MLRASPLLAVAPLEDLRRHRQEPRARVLAWRGSWEFSDPAELGRALPFHLSPFRFSAFPPFRLALQQGGASPAQHPTARALVRAQFFLPSYHKLPSVRYLRKNPPWRRGGRTRARLPCPLRDQELHKCVTCYLPPLIRTNHLPKATPKSSAKKPGTRTKAGGEPRATVPAKQLHAPGATQNDVSGQKGLRSEEDVCLVAIDLNDLRNS